MKKTASGLQELSTLLRDKATQPARGAGPTPAHARRGAAPGASAHQDGSRHIALTRAVKLYCWNVIGQVAKASKREELMPILLRAREAGATDARDVAAHLLFDAGSRQGVAQRLLQIAENYGLLALREKRYFLTPAGERAVQTQQVFVPEHGAWTIWASDDPLLATPILLVKPWAEPTAMAEVWGEERDAERTFEKLPSWLRAAVGAICIPVAAKNALRIDHLESRGEVVDVMPSLRATWNTTEAKLRVTGTLDDAPVNAVAGAPDIDASAAWRQLLEPEGLWPQWDQAAGALRVGFAETEPSARQTFVQSVHFAKPSIAGYGRFDAVTVSGVAIRARSQSDADQWAAWRLKVRINTYATADNFRKWTEDAIAPLAEFMPAVPSRNALADAAWQAGEDRPTSTTWHLAAAEDWSL